MAFTPRIWLIAAAGVTFINAIRPTAAIVAGVVVALTGMSFAQSSRSATAPYCADLKRVVALASARDRFTSITGKLREGNFHDTMLPLPGWKNCSLYGATTYTCDSQTFKTAAEAEKAQARVADEILSCFAGTWLELKDRSSPSYVVLHPTSGPASITLSLDETESKEFLARLTLFIRRNN